MSSFYFGSSSSATVNKNQTNKVLAGNNTKISVSILGDAFVDLFCFLNDGAGSTQENRNALPKLGADVRINQPVKPVAGGSGINTATHLASLVEKFPSPLRHGDDTSQDPPPEEGEEVDQMDVTLQTVVNENDDYGRLLLDHAKSHNFEIINCRRDTTSVGASTATATATTSSNEGNQQQNKHEEEDKKKDVVSTQNNTPAAATTTGHCVVFVTQNERSFITHLGVIESFQPSHTMLHELVQCRSANPTFINHHHHIHIAGYYNMTKFQSPNALKKRMKLIREKRRTQSHGKHVYTTTISLTPQYDATEEWSTVELFNLLPLVDFLILNLVEACKICKVARLDAPEQEDEEEEKDTDFSTYSKLFVKLADIFDTQSPQTYVVVTLGKLGAVLLYGGDIIHTQSSPRQYDSPVDSTGAGDAFVSGFVFGTMNWRRERQHNQVYEIGSVLEEAGGWNEAIEVGMKWGCVAGSACVMKAGASVPSSEEEIRSLLEPKDGNSDDDSDDEEEQVESDEDEYESSEYESELDSDFDPDEEDDSISDYSSSCVDDDEDQEEDDEVDKDSNKWV